MKLFNIIWILNSFIFQEIQYNTKDISITTYIGSDKNWYRLYQNRHKPNIQFNFYLLRTRSKDMSEFNDIIKRRRMVRQYIQDKPIPQVIIDKLIANAHRAPSAGHTQVQEFIINNFTYHAYYKQYN